MRKRLLSVGLAVLFIFLSGCGGKTSDYEEPENRLYVSALGFDREDEEIRVTAEVISISDNTSGDEYSIKHYRGEGNSVDSAMYEITKNLASAVNLSHCALAVVGENMTGEYFGELVDYCFNNKEITQSIQLISTDNAEELLQYNKESTKPLGFCLGDFLAEDPDGTGAGKDSTLVSVMNYLRSAEDCFYLPFFEVEDKNYLLSGARLYKGRIPLYKLSRLEFQLLSIARGTFRGGEVMLDTEPQSRVIHIKSAKSRRWLDEGDPMTLKLEIEFKTDRRAGNTTDIEKEIEKKMTGLLGGLRDNCGVDALSVGAEIKKRYKSVSDSELLTMVNNTHISVDCGFRKGGTE